MNKFEVKDLGKDKYLLNMIQEQEDFMISNGLSFSKNELYELYLKLRDIFSN